MANREPEGRTGVISIVDRLERRAVDRMRTQAANLHLREAEVVVERFEGARSIKETDYEALLDEVDERAVGPDEARVTRAKLRSTRALQSCLRGDTEAGFAEWEEAMAEAPELAFPYLVRGRWKMNADAASALDDYDRAAEIEPTDPLVYWRRGDCYAALGDVDRALANFRRALALDPTSLDELQTMAKLLATHGDHVEAVRVYDKAIALSSRYVDLHAGRARSLETLGDYEAAARDHARIIEIDPARLGARFSLAICLNHLGHLERAIDELERLIVLEPGDHHNHRTLGKLYFDVRRSAEALEHLTRAIELAPEDGICFAFRAYAYLMAGDRGLAVADFERAMELEPAEPGHWLGRALARSLLVSRPEQRADLDAILERFPENRLALTQRAGLSFKEGEHALAVADYSAVFAHEAPEADLLVARSRSLGPLGRIEEAMADVERALELSPDHPIAHVLRGVFGHHLKRDPAQVEADFDRAVALAPEDANILATRGEHLQDLEKHSAAVRDYDRVIALAPRAASPYYHRGYSRSRLEEERWDDEDWEEPEAATTARLLECVEDFERAIELGLRSDDVYLELYGVQQERGDLALARAALDRGLEADPSSGLLIRVRYHLLLSMKDAEGAALDRARGEAMGMTFD